MVCPDAVTLSDRVSDQPKVRAFMIANIRGRYK
jgi:hypothetical protein